MAALRFACRQPIEQRRREVRRPGGLRRARTSRPSVSGAERLEDARGSPPAGATILRGALQKLLAGRGSKSAREVVAAFILTAGWGSIDMRYYERLKQGRFPAV